MCAIGVKVLFNFISYLIALAFITFVFIVMALTLLMIPQTLVVYLLLIGAIVIFFLTTRQTWKLEKWKSVELNKFFMVGHLGTASLIWIWAAMKEGGASGLFLMPSLIWALIFYGKALSAIDQYFNHLKQSDS